VSCRETKHYDGAKDKLGSLPPDLSWLRRMFAELYNVESVTGELKYPRQTACVNFGLTVAAKNYCFNKIMESSGVRKYLKDHDELLWLQQCILYILDYGIE
jgi:hypothetical protein